MCMDSVGVIKGYTVPQFDNAEMISSCWVWERWNRKKSEMNPLNYSRCCRNTRIKLYFSVSENVYVQWFLMEAFWKKMHNCQVRSLVKKTGIESYDASIFFCLLKREETGNKKDQHKLPTYQWVLSIRIVSSFCIAKLLE